MSIVIDAAGARQGGAARFLLELDHYLGSSSPARTGAVVLGRGKQLTTTWMIRRELEALRARRKVALNNVAFMQGRGERVVLLRNALHFPFAGELEALGFRRPLRLQSQTPVVHYAANQADVLIVPTSSMAERVARYLPAAAKRIVVRPHPVRPRKWAGTPGIEPQSVLVPIIPSAYKNLDIHVRQLLEATEGLTPAIFVYATGYPAQYPSVSHHPRLRLIGKLHAEDLDGYWARSGAVFFPPTTEAFGYPLAEARASGRYVIAPSTPQNVEVAASALRGYTVSDLSSLRAAVTDATGSAPVPDPRPFDPQEYFSWLIAEPDLV